MGQGPNTGLHRSTVIPPTFFLDEVLYRVLRIDRSNDELMMWNYATRERVLVSYAYALKNFERAYSNKEVAKFMRFSRGRLVNLIYAREVTPPGRIYTIEGNKPYGFRWHPRSIRQLRDFLSERAKGPPRKDGKVIPRASLPSRAELSAMLDGKATMYIKNEKGEFIPTWRA